MNFAEVVEKYVVRPITGVLHVGAHHGEAADTYEAAKVAQVIWIEGDQTAIDPLWDNVQFRVGHEVIGARVDDHNHCLDQLDRYKTVSPADHRFGEFNFWVFTIPDADLRAALRGATVTLRYADYVYAEAGTHLDEIDASLAEFQRVSVGEGDDTELWVRG